MCGGPEEELLDWRSAATFAIGLTPIFSSLGSLASPWQREENRKFVEAGQIGGNRPTA